MATSTINRGMAFDTLYDGTKVVSGTVTLSKAYTDYDLIFVEGKVNVNSASGVFTPSTITTSTSYDISMFIQGSGVYYASNCSIKRSSDTAFAVTQQGNNANFQLGVTKVIGIKFS